MTTINGVLKKIIKQGDTPGSRDFCLVEFMDPDTKEWIEGKLSVALGGVGVGDSFSVKGNIRENTFRGKTEKIINGTTVSKDFPQSEEAVRAFLKTNLSYHETGVSHEDLDDFVDENGMMSLSEIWDDHDSLFGLSARGRPKELEKLSAFIDDYLSPLFAKQMMSDANFNDKQIGGVIELFKGDVYQSLKRDPYLVLKIPTISFEEADQLGQKLGISSNDARRINATIWDYLSRAASQGSTLVSLSGAVDYISSKYNLSSEEVKKHVNILQQSEEKSEHFSIISFPDIDDIFASLNRYYEAEVKCSFAIMKAAQRGFVNDPNKVREAVEKAVSGTLLDEYQRKAVEVGSLYQVSVITGGPGTGKSTILEKIIEVSQEVEKRDIFVTAPTGKAASRAEEVTGEEGNTLQMILGQQFNGSTGETHFTYNAKNPLPDNILLIVDEVSMMDVELMAALFDALPPSGRVILQGDPKQLRSVGAGRVMGDIVEMNIDGQHIVPVAHLVNVYRQDKNSKVALDSHLISRGVMPEMGEDLEEGVAFKKCQKRDIKNTVGKIIDDHVIGGGFDPVEDMIVICPQAPGAGGTWEMNQYLADRLNPDREEIPFVEHGKFDDTRLPLPHVGDRVMLTENHNDLRVMNGDVGVITGYEIKEGKGSLKERVVIQVRFDNGKEFELPAKNWRELILSYAITCHKSQGSQYPVVIMPFSDEMERMADKSLAFTAWTRTKKLVFGVGDKSVFETFVKTDKGEKHFTLLRKMTEFVMGVQKIKPLGESERNIPSVKIPTKDDFNFLNSVKKVLSKNSPRSVRRRVVAASPMLSSPAPSSAPENKVDTATAPSAPVAAAPQVSVVRRRKRVVGTVSAGHGQTVKVNPDPIMDEVKNKPAENALVSEVNKIEEQEKEVEKPSRPVAVRRARRRVTTLPKMT